MAFVAPPALGYVALLTKVGRNTEATYGSDRSKTGASVAFLMLEHSAVVQTRRDGGNRSPTIVG